MAELRESAPQQTQQQPLQPPPPPPPTIQRRPRVREVSSRFMSSVVSSSSSSGDLLHLVKSPVVPKQQNQLGFLTPNPSRDFESRPQRSDSVQRRRRQLEMEVYPPLRTSDENRIIDTHRSLETPGSLASHCQAVKQRTMKPSKENRGKSDQQKTCSRPDTPNLTCADRMKVSNSRLRLMQQRSANHTVSAATRLLQSNLVSSQDPTLIPLNHPSSPNHDSDNHNPKLDCTTRSLSDLRSSMPEVDMLPSVSGRLLPEKSCNKNNSSGGGDALKFSASTCSRSLNFSSSSCDNSMFHSVKGSEKHVPTLSQTSSNSLKMGGLCLPPVPPCVKIGTEARKGKKISGHQEDVHSLRLLHNRYLQWRYANAKAEASLQAQQRETERTAYSLGLKISELYDSVKRKRVELEFLRRRTTLLEILDTQIPYLEEWSAVEEDYSISLSEAVHALSNSSIRLPVSGNVRVDIREVGEAMNSAAKVMESIVYHVQSFIPKAEETEILVSELARVTGGERALVEECGELLSKTYASQVFKCSLRGQLIQLQSVCT